MEHKDFKINYRDALADRQEELTVRHTTETFELEFDGARVALINNGDNSWSLVNGAIDQETVNLIGDAIERKLKNS